MALLSIWYYLRYYIVYSLFTCVVYCLSRMETSQIWEFLCFSHRYDFNILNCAC